MSKVPVIWTTRSLRNALSIKKYLADNFTEIQIENFENLLEDFKKAVSQFPELYPASGIKKGLRKAVLNKYLSVFYIFRNGEITVIAMQDNRQESPGE